MEEEVAADTILERFRDLSSIAAGSISNLDFESKYQTLALALYNEIMNESLTITANTTGTYLKDEAIAHIATSLAYQKIHRTKMYKDTGMLEWQRFMQSAYEMMYIINPTKIEYREGRDIYTIRDPDSKGQPYMYSVGLDSTGSSSSSFGT
jgi:hypothetical protein|tara:strand:+ start:141 stop:593 length:453 start_codon:yes stop_codon:yes gene_type:complete